MRAVFWLVISAAYALADTQNRRTKLPYIADAVGNSLPPPSNVPATVGSPVNLLTPDRYEFYTFDESGELVKRLMTLEEIQAIVAAGEETDGLVTFANDNQPTIAFNFTQPSQTKVHSVVTNVQNVLKAQMEAHKKKPNIQPTLDTPDVSDTWSLILPSIFGNTGVDIVPDKTSASFITPETETFEIDTLNDFKHSETKESNEIPTISTHQENGSDNEIEIKESASSGTTATPSNFVSSSKPTTMAVQVSTSTKFSEVKRDDKITTSLPHISSSTTTSSIKVIEELTNNSISQKQDTSQENHNDDKQGNPNVTKITNQNLISTNQAIQYERITFSPVATEAYVTAKTTSRVTIGGNESNNENFLTTTIIPKVITSATLSEMPPNKDTEFDKFNSTTITTQSISPSATISSTELSSALSHISISNSIKNKTAFDDSSKENEPVLPVFDVALSISQIASDLGNNFVPVPTSNTLLDTTKTSPLAIESKENLEIDIPTEIVNDVTTSTAKNTENFIKVSTFEPQEKFNNKTQYNILNITKENSDISSLPPSLSTIASPTVTNVIDTVISESMDDLLSQVVNNGPDPTSIIYFQNKTQPETNIVTTQNPTSLVVTMENKILETTTKLQHIATTIPTLLLEERHSELAKTPIKNVTHINNVENSNLVSQNIKKNDDNKTKPVSNMTYSIYTTKVKNNLFNNATNIEKHNKSEFGNKVDKNVVLSNHNLPKKTNINITHVNGDLTTESNNVTFNSNVYKSTLTHKISVNNNISDKSQIQKFKEELPKNDEFKKKIQKVNIDDKELANERNNSWKLIPTLSPPKANEEKKDKHKVEGFYTPESIENKNIVLGFPKENQGLEVTTKDLGDDILQFTELCNELAFRYWNVLAENTDKKRSIVFSPYSITSMLAMMFMGAKGATSGEMNEVLKLDDMVTFNPHFTLKNISDSIETTSASGVAISAFIRELYSERNKGKMLTFYKERAQHFYNGHVEEVNFKLISDVIRRRTNLLVKRYTWGKIPEYLKTNSITMNPPLAAFSANIFYTDCTGSSVEGRDGEMYFVVSPNVRQRRLVPVPAVVYKSNFLAGYDPVLDATAAALGNTNSIVSTLFLMPGQQGNVVHADDLEKLEKRFLDTNLNTIAWNGLLRTLLPRVGLELQIPRFSHKSIFNVSSTLKKMGLKELFDADRADLGGLNGPSKDLYLSDMLQLTTFVTCGEGVISEQHHVEEFPDVPNSWRKRRTSRWITGWDEPRDYQRAFHDPHDVGEAMNLPLHLRPRQARLPTRSSQPARLKFDRPFLYFVRHNPSGMILYVGRYNPRLLP